MTKPQLGWFSQEAEVKDNCFQSNGAGIFIKGWDTDPGESAGRYSGNTIISAGAPIRGDSDYWQGFVLVGNTFNRLLPVDLTRDGVGMSHNTVDDRVTDCGVPSAPPVPEIAGD